MSIGFVFSPGWSLGRDFFKPLSECLKTYPQVYLKDNPDLREGIWIGIGHSLGFARLLSLPLQGVVSLSGFVRFCAHTSSQNGTATRVMNRMITKFKANPHEVLKDFYKQAAMENFLTRALISFNKRQLLVDLELMKRMDLTSELSGLRIPILSLAAKDDKIVPFALTQETFQSSTTLEKGGHAIALTQADWCAKEINNWIVDAFNL